MESRDDMVVKYFSLGLQQREIITMLESVHNIIISPRNLKRILKKNNSYGRRNFSNPNTVAAFIESQLSGSGQMHGYRWMHLKCIQHGLVVTQETVRELLKLLDPTGVDIRKRKRLRRRQYVSKGPNYVWHVDSYDKLKPYGICINGAIDGFSRNIMWLKAGRTSSDPKVIAGYYVRAVKSLGGCPQTVRSDMGTENGTMERIQTALKSFFEMKESQKPAFLYGRSTANQRIESWWCILRKQNVQYWINLFQTLKEEGLFNGTFVDKSLIQFCFMTLIQDELDQVVGEWNSHRIRSSRNSISPTGRPIIMFEAPYLYHCENCLVDIPAAVIENLEQECTFHTNQCDEDMKTLCEELILENNFSCSFSDPYEASQMYIKLKEKVYEIIED
ncbi:unnamed protein product [Brassicogethes aeneus]|uniref:Integrase core domain-containing protein n=1 Tax=Brassicogethes aeneus TaxID=1431903 RepID=A0A9P0FDQ4_BRAAE|nr:unnamed protein product [Brassicogethes aeneus]